MWEAGKTNHRTRPYVHDTRLCDSLYGLHTSVGSVVTPPGESLSPVEGFFAHDLIPLPKNQTPEFFTDALCADSRPCRPGACAPCKKLKVQADLTTYRHRLTLICIFPDEVPIQ